MRKILVIGQVWPEPTTTAAGIRMLQLISIFKELQYIIYFGSPAQTSKYSTDFKDQDIQFVPVHLNNDQFDQQIQNLQPHIVIYDRFVIEEQFGWRVKEFCPQAISILNTEDLHCLRNTREFAVKKNLPYTTSLLLEQEITKREIASIYRCDLSLIISLKEIEVLDNTFRIPPQQLIYLPLFVEHSLDHLKDHWKTFEDRTGFMTIGNGRHTPNSDSVLYLKEKIWPLVRKQLPKAACNVYGAYLPEKVNQLHNPKEGFYIQGWVVNKDEVFTKAKVCLAPLRFGAGIKGKLLDAMRNGTPSITTSIGAEGMLSEDGDWNGFITDTPENFAKAAIKVYQNKQLWLQCQQNGLETIRTQFNKAPYFTILKDRLHKVVTNLKAHRNQNFTGAMLHYHTLRSTMFMSRWIEEKNKNN
ncbi:glycosyltransferase family 4 protein [Aquimarina sp. ERC-38]|uniref:glycosyltransferase n=1 Tax=Aquimarina sp. ERC-38 TaxID=2949996 RepID=UPI002247233F|nr:glycosyltransferase [Aquimarina sp. ERC-38]UZO80586.1 glycosyltransferase family 4 protein [Aquimarina sp. ERC-38]